MNKIIIQGYYCSYNVKFSMGENDVIYVSVPWYDFHYNRFENIPDDARETLKSILFWSDAMLDTLELELRKPVQSIAEKNPYLDYEGKFRCNNCTENIDLPYRRWAKKVDGKWIYFTKKDNDILYSAYKYHTLFDKYRLEGVDFKSMPYTFDGFEIQYRLYKPKKIIKEK